MLYVVACVSCYGNTTTVVKLDRALRYTAELLKTVRYCRYVVNSASDWHEWGRLGDDYEWQSNERKKHVETSTRALTV